MNKGNDSKLIFRDARKEKRETERFEDSLKSIQDMAESHIVEQSVRSFAEEQSKKYDLDTSKKIDGFKLSYIEDYEEEKAKQLIEECLGFEPPRSAGFQMAVKIYVRPEETAEFIKDDGTKGMLYLPQMVTGRDKFVNCTALVLSQGPDCYTGKRFEVSFFEKIFRFFFGKWLKPTKKMPWCKVGDWVVIPRNEGTQVNYRGIPVQYIFDDKVLGTVEDPSYVTRD